MPFPSQGGMWQVTDLLLTVSPLHARSPKARVSEACVGAEHPQACRWETRGLSGGPEGLQHLCPVPDLADHSDPDPLADTHRFESRGLFFHLSRGRQFFLEQVGVFLASLTRKIGFEGG